MPEWRMKAPVDFEFCAGEHLAIVGPNGGGKSMLVDILIGRHPLLMRDPEYDFYPSGKKLASENIKYITFRDSYGGDNDKEYFHQQRWNRQMIDDSNPTLLFSSGELRKYKLAQAMESTPRVMILDNPFIGLDAPSREVFKDRLAEIAGEGKVCVILVLSKTDEIPSFITHVYEVKDMLVGPKMTLSEYLASREPRPASVLSDEMREAIAGLPYSDTEYSAAEVVKMNKVSIRYGDRTILKELDWTVENGERWALSGSNGSGKSTLLSLVCADNPQSYACDISLFGMKRGTGESIWDIKKHIGYVSPEMHRAYREDKPCIRIVASGLMDYSGLYIKPKEEDYDKCRFWMKVFGIEGIADRTFLKVSSGEQRMVLVARAFVRDPELLILDEPLHGLDMRNRALVQDVIGAFCERRNKTLIMVTHYKEELPPCINRSLVLKKNRMPGRIVYDRKASFPG